MQMRQSPHKLFLIASLLSGLGSSLSVAIPPVALLFPGLFFGLALAYAANRTILPLSTGQKVAIVSGTTIAYLLAILTSLLSMRVVGIGNSFEASAIPLGSAGGVGGLLIALTLAVLFEEFRLAVCIVSISIIGFFGGILFAVIATYVLDNMFAILVLFPLWQVAVASTIAFLHSQNLARYNAATDL